MPETTTERRTCQGTTKAGLPCRFTPEPGKDYCLWHDPDKTKAQWAAMKGATAMARCSLPDTGGIRLGTAAGCLAAAERVTKAVLAGELHERIAKAAIYGISIAARVAEVAVLERRVRLLEEQAGARRRR